MTTRTPLMTMTAVQALCKTAITKPDQFSQCVLALEDSASAETFKLDCCGDSAKCAPVAPRVVLQSEGKVCGYLGAETSGQRFSNRTARPGRCGGVESGRGLEGVMRLLILSGLFVLCVTFSQATASQVGAAQEADIGKSGTEFM